MKKKRLDRNDNGPLSNMGKPETRPIFISRLVARKRGSTSGWLAMIRPISTGPWREADAPSTALTTRLGKSKPLSR